MLRALNNLSVFYFFCFSETSSFPLQRKSHISRLQVYRCSEGIGARKKEYKDCHTNSDLANDASELKGKSLSPHLNLLTLGAIVFSGSSSASAAGLEQIPSALAAYGHFASLLVVAMSLAIERLVIKPGMTVEEEEKLANTDIAYGLSGLLLTITGYLRVTEYGKGADFYLHSPIFWIKMFLLAVMGASSLFPTINIIERAVARRQGQNVAPISEALAARMTTIINAELLAVVSIPLAASLMARGVGFENNGIPWQLGAFPVLLALVGLGYRYTNEALSWEEPVAVEADET